jgi:pyrimidine deaminase RibD-like protein
MDHIVPNVWPHTTNLHHATILLRNKVIAAAYNRVGSRSRGCGYGARTIHAEVNAVKSLGNMAMLRGATLIVVRHGCDGTIRPSKPCHNCHIFLEKCMRLYGLRKVVYS